MQPGKQIATMKLPHETTKAALLLPTILCPTPNVLSLAFKPHVSDSTLLKSMQLLLHPLHGTARIARRLRLVTTLVALLLIQSSLVIVVFPITSIAWCLSW
jgi:hypothetical protein